MHIFTLYELEELLISFETSFAFHIETSNFFPQQIKYDNQMKYWFLYGMETSFYTLILKMSKHYPTLIKLFTEKKLIIYSAVTGEVHVYLKEK